MGRFGWVYLGAGLLAVLTARPYAGSWNDGSRLATVECLVDQHTWAIDDSIYVVPSKAARQPYGENTLAAQNGTLDKLLIDGRFYSDKSPVPACLMAGVYQIWRWAGGPSAAERPDWFARLLTWVFASVPYLLAVVSIAWITRHVAVPTPWDVVLTASFAFGSLALPYAQHVNNHVLLLAVATGVCEAAVRPGPLTIRRAAWLGCSRGSIRSIRRSTIALQSQAWCLAEPQAGRSLWIRVLLIWPRPFHSPLFTTRWPTRRQHHRRPTPTAYPTGRLFTGRT